MVLKWLVFPAALAAFGYYVVGPRIGKVGLPSGIAQPEPSPARETAAAPASQARTYPAPDVDVSVSGSAAASRPPRRRHRRKPKPDVEAPPTTAPDVPVDSGGSGGAVGGGT